MVVFTAREEAITLGKELLRRHFIHHVTYEHDFEDDYLFYRFLEDVKTRSLNAGLSHHCLPRKGTPESHPGCVCVSGGFYILSIIFAFCLKFIFIQIFSQPMKLPMTFADS